MVMRGTLKVFKKEKCNSTLTHPNWSARQRDTDRTDGVLSTQRAGAGFLLRSAATK